MESSEVSGRLDRTDLANMYADVMHIRNLGVMQPSRPFINKYWRHVQEHLRSGKQLDKDTSGTHAGGATGVCFTYNKVGKEN